MDNVHLTSAIDLKIDRILDNHRFELHNDSLNRQTVTGRSFDDGHVTQPAERHIECSWNRSRGHGHNVDLFLDLFQTFFMSDAKALLFVDDHESQVMEFNVLGQQAVGADNNIELAGFEIAH